MYGGFTIHAGVGTGTHGQDNQLLCPVAPPRALILVNRDAAKYSQIGAHLEELFAAPETQSLNPLYPFLPSCVPVVREFMQCSIGDG